MIHVHIYNMCVWHSLHIPPPHSEAHKTVGIHHCGFLLRLRFRVSKVLHELPVMVVVAEWYHYITITLPKKTELKGTLWCGWETLSSSLALHLTGNMDTHSSWTLSESSKMLVQYWKSRFYLWGCYCIWICGKSLVGVKATEKPPLP